MPFTQASSKPEESTEPAQRSGMFRGLISSILMDCFGPYLVYRLANPHVSQVAALCWTMLPPLANSIWTFLRKRHLDIVGLLVIAGIAAGLLLFLFGGSPRLFLIRESFITGAIGILFLVSLMFRRPLSYYISRQFTTGNDPARVANWDRQYARSRYKFGMRLITAVWGFVLVGEAVLRTGLAFYLSVATFLALYNFVYIGIYALAMAWSYSYGWRTYRREQFVDN